jgi:hypothetical protein
MLAASQISMLGFPITISLTMIIEARGEDPILERQVDELLMPEGLNLASSTQICDFTPHETNRKHTKKC